MHSSPRPSHWRSSPTSCGGAECPASTSTELWPRSRSGSSRGPPRPTAGGAGDRRGRRDRARPAGGGGPHASGRGHRIGVPRSSRRRGGARARDPCTGRAVVSAGALPAPAGGPPVRRRSAREAQHRLPRRRHELRRAARRAARVLRPVAAGRALARRAGDRRHGRRGDRAGGDAGDPADAAGSARLPASHTATTASAGQRGATRQIGTALAGRNAT
jgi:hypothetical protein